MIIAIPLGFSLMIASVQSEIVKDVYVQGAKWTAYDIPPSGADLKLNVKRGTTAPPILTSHIRVEDTDDTAVWTNVSKASDLHEYRILGVTPGTPRDRLIVN